MKPIKKIQKNLERRLRGHQQLGSCAKGQIKAYRAPGSRNPKKN